MLEWEEPGVRVVHPKICDLEYCTSPTCAEVGTCGADSLAATTAKAMARVIMLSRASGSNLIAIVSSFPSSSSDSSSSAVLGVSSSSRSILNRSRLAFSFHLGSPMKGTQ